MLKRIKLGDWVKALIHTVSFGYGERIAGYIAIKLGYQSCGCCQRAEWLNKLTNPEYDGECNGIKLW